MLATATSQMMELKAYVAAQVMFDRKFYANLLGIYQLLETQQLPTKVRKLPFDIYLI